MGIFIQHVVVADFQLMLRKHPEAIGMDSAHEHPAQHPDLVFPEHATHVLTDAIFKLSRRLLGEREGDNFFRLGPAP